MSKYNEIMQKVRVDDDMKTRILNNIEKEFESKKSSVRHQDKKRLFEFRRYAAIAAAFAVVAVGTYAVMQNGGMRESAPMEAPASESQQMDTATYESAYESAGESENEAANDYANATDFEEEASEDSYDAKPAMKSDDGMEAVGAPANGPAAEPEPFAGQEAVSEETGLNDVKDISPIPIAPVIVVAILLILAAFIAIRIIRKKNK